MKLCSSRSFRCLLMAIKQATLQYGITQSSTNCKPIKIMKLLMPISQSYANSQNQFKLKLITLLARSHSSLLAYFNLHRTKTLRLLIIIQAIKNYKDTHLLQMQAVLMGCAYFLKLSQEQSYIQALFSFSLGVKQHARILCIIYRRSGCIFLQLHQPRQALSDLH